MQRISLPVSVIFTRQLTVFILTSLLSVFLVACSTVSPPVPTTPKPLSEKAWKERETTLNHVKNYQVTGKIAVRTSKDSGSANVDWRQNNGRYYVALTGPMGAGGLTLRGGPGSVTLFTGDGKHYTASSAEQLLAEKWGFHLPVSNMNYWIKGLPVPGIPYKSQFDPNNRLASLSQAGFFIQYSDYTRSGNYDLPHRISISSAELKTKIVIYNWKIF